MRKIWEKIKWPLFLAIWTIGVIGWCYFYQEFKTIRSEANWTWNEVQQLQEQKVEIKNDGSKRSDEETVKAVSLDEEAKSGEKVATTSPPVGEIEKIIYGVFGKDKYKEARAIAMAESHLRPEAINKNVNGSTDCGVFQINSIHGLEDCHDPVKNIEYAKKLFDRSGWSPWVAYKSGKYLAYMK